MDQLRIPVLTIWETRIDPRVTDKIESLMGDFSVHAAGFVKFECKGVGDQRLAGASYEGRPVRGHAVSGEVPSVQKIRSCEARLEAAARDTAYASGRIAC